MSTLSHDVRIYTILYKKIPFNFYFSYRPNVTCWWTSKYSRHKQPFHSTRKSRDVFSFSQLQSVYSGSWPKCRRRTFPACYLAWKFVFYKLNFISQSNDFIISSMIIFILECLLSNYFILSRTLESPCNMSEDAHFYDTINFNWLYGSIRYVLFNSQMVLLYPVHRLYTFASHCYQTFLTRNTIIPRRSKPTRPAINTSSFIALLAVLMQAGQVRFSSI